MYWTSASNSFSRASALESIMEKEGFQLEDLLDEDEIVQETKSQNSKLVNYLKQKPNLEKIIRYVVEEPQESLQDSQKQRYPYICCEVICCEADGLLSALAGDDQLMDLLFSVIDQSKRGGHNHSQPFSPRTRTENGGVNQADMVGKTSSRANVTNMGYFARITSTLLVRKTMDVMRYLHKNSHLLVKLVQHIRFGGAQEVILRLVGADESTSAGMSIQHKMWLGEGPILDELIKCMDASNSQLAIQNAGEVLATIAVIRPSHMNDRLLEPDTLVRLCKRIEESNGEILVPVLSVLICCLQPTMNNMNSSVDSMGSSETSSLDTKDDQRNIASRTLAEFLPNILKYLDIREGEESELQLPYGVLRPPLGLKRLKIVELIATIVQLRDRQSLLKIIEIDVVQRCLSLFRQYPHNNMLHGSVSNLILSGAASSEEEFQLHIFQDCHLVGWLTSLPMEVTVHGGNDKPIRAGYQGHVIHISERLCHIATDNLRVQNYLEQERQWPTFFVNVLQPAMQVNDIKSWRCGRPRSILLMGEDWQESRAVDREDDDDDDEDELIHDSSIQKIPAPYHPVVEDDEEGLDDNGTGLDEEGGIMWYVSPVDGESQELEEEFPVTREEEEEYILPTRLNLDDSSEEDLQQEQVDQLDEEYTSEYTKDIIDQNSVQNQPQLQQEYTKEGNTRNIQSDVQGLQVIIQELSISDQEDESSGSEESGGTEDTSGSETLDSLSSSSDGSGELIGQDA
eukprot:TRINITY_DN6051_c0_g1_i1.p1 TRINITY_DN6051_c0_g1~~TRINITY_DN6051_c0_g1_i1.p1  ORF type:complete len:740 (-),score=96.69 TRINITY_DN6051_c0_g1_i1:2448-4667(-)